MHARTAAHKTLPMGTMVKVTNIQNGKSTVVRINDRGPFVKGRIIDCSYAAGKELGLDRLGIAKVEIEVLGYHGKIQKPKI
jgi:rare lipoprotein A